MFCFICLNKLHFPFDISDYGHYSYNTTYYWRYQTAYTLMKVYTNKFGYYSRGEIKQWREGVVSRKPSSFKSKTDIGRSVGEHIIAINTCFDTLLSESRLGK